MSTIDLSKCSIEELWKYVGSELAKNGVDVILVGGAVVSIYTEGAYESGDLDFVLNDFSRIKLNSVLSRLGFVQKSRHYIHPECRHLYLEFATFPAGIGNDTSIVPEEVPWNGQKLKIYSPTDSVRDRLASYIHFKALDCLDQAVMIAQRHPINFEKVRKWCAQEGHPKAFEDFHKQLNGQ